jgi:DNA-directed RNA polymerase specialized sigma24 family protein
LLDESLAAIDELPVPQREVFAAHQIEGRSFVEIAQAAAEKPGTLISRKHQAVLYLWNRLMPDF